MAASAIAERRRRSSRSFKQAESSLIRVLVIAKDVASEGVNLHRQCHELIHFDIPWSLIRIEQRNGRIDRYGQKHPPRITSLLLEPDHERFRGDLRVLARLMEKENEAHGALGDVASLMGKHDVKAEEDAIRAVLARQEAARRRRTHGRRSPPAATSTGLFFRLFARHRGTTPASCHPGRGNGRRADARASTPTTVSFLDEALHAAFPTPTQPARRGRRLGGDDDEPRHAPQLRPAAPTSRQRLDVLPQSYLRRAQGHRAARPRDDQGPRSGSRSTHAPAIERRSRWPDAHYLGPLHPVLDWAATGRWPASAATRSSRCAGRCRRVRRCCCSARSPTVADSRRRRLAHRRLPATRRQAFALA